MSDHIHVVQKGDTLSAISKNYYKDAKYYPHIAELNNIDNPDLIYVDQKITIPKYLKAGFEMKDGCPVIHLVRICLPKKPTSVFNDISTLEKAAIKEGYSLKDRISAFRKIKYDSGPAKTLLGMVVGGGGWDILIPGASHVKLPNSWNTSLLTIKEKLKNNPVMKINGDDVDIFHVFAGLDAKNHPTPISLGGGVVKMRSNHEAATFIGDLGSVVVWYIKNSKASFYDTARKLNKQLLNYYYDDPSSNDQKCSVADMNGNIDSYLINPTTTIFDSFEDYYESSTGKYSNRMSDFYNILMRSKKIDIQEEIFNSAIAVAVSIKQITDVALIFKDPGPGPSLKLPFIGDIGTPTFWEMYWNVSGWVTDLLFEKIKKGAGK